MRRLLIRLYTAEWRDRYGAELLDLLTEGPLSPRVMSDVMSAGLKTRIRAHRGRYRTIVALTAFGLADAWAVQIGVSTTSCGRQPLPFVPPCSRSQ